MVVDLCHRFHRQEEVLIANSQEPTAADIEHANFSFEFADEEGTDVPDYLAILIDHPPPPDILTIVGDG